MVSTAFLASEICQYFARKHTDLQKSRVCPKKVQNNHYKGKQWKILLLKKHAVKMKYKSWKPNENNLSPTPKLPK